MTQLPKSSRRTRILPIATAITARAPADWVPIAKPAQALSSTWTGGDWEEAGSLSVEKVTLETGVWR